MSGHSSPAETILWQTSMEAMPALIRLWTWPEHVFTGLAWKQTSPTTSSSALHASSAATYQLNMLQPHKVPPRPWVKIGVDFFQDHLGKKHLIVADYFSKFPYMFPVASTHHFQTITHLRELFAAEGIPAIMSCLTMDLPSMEKSLGSFPVTLTLFTPHRHPISIS